MIAIPPEARVTCVALLHGLLLQPPWLSCGVDEASRGVGGSDIPHAKNRLQEPYGVWGEANVQQ